MTVMVVGGGGGGGSGATTNVVLRGLTVSPPVGDVRVGAGATTSLLPSGESDSEGLLMPVAVFAPSVRVEGLINRLPNSSGDTEDKVTGLSLIHI